MLVVVVVVVVVVVLLQLNFTYLMHTYFCISGVKSSMC
jgi:hypothetical protein